MIKGSKNHSTSLNPKALSLLKKNQYKTISIPDWAKAISNKEIASLSRAITLIESTLPEEQLLAQKLMSACKPFNHKTIRIGITGAPGVGKSSFIDSFGSHLLKHIPSQLAVLSIDPSSPAQGGSILGDKTRMSTLANNQRVFIRPSPSLAALGGINYRTREVISLCEYAGYDIIFIETVGVGQNEAAIKDLCDILVLLINPASGDELQGIKKGITEMADLIVVNKNDSGLESAATQTQAQYQNALKYNRSASEIKVIKCSSLQHKGLTEIETAIKRITTERRADRSWANKRKKQFHTWLDSRIKEKWMDLLNRHLKDHKISNFMANAQKNKNNITILAAKYINSVQIKRRSKS